MSTSNLIRNLCKEKGISVAELARRICQTPQNFNKKLKRETVSTEELMFSVQDVQEEEKIVQHTF